MMKKGGIMAGNKKNTKKQEGVSIRISDKSKDWIDDKRKNTSILKFIDAITDKVHISYDTSGNIVVGLNYK